MEINRNCMDIDKAYYMEIYLVDGTHSLKFFDSLKELKDYINSWLEWDLLNVDYAHAFKSSKYHMHDKLLMKYKANEDSIGKVIEFVDAH